MGALIPIPKRQPIDIFVPHVPCEVPNCEKERKFDMVVLFLKEQRLDLYQICAQHAFLWKGFAPALFFPLNTSPSLPWLVQRVQEEIQRRNPPRPVYHYNVFGNVTGATGNVYFRFN
jgi:hypothetical protein